MVPGQANKVDTQGCDTSKLLAKTKTAVIQTKATLYPDAGGAAFEGENFSLHNYRSCAIRQVYFLYSHTLNIFSTTM